MIHLVDSDSMLNATWWSKVEASTRPQPPFISVLRTLMNRGVLALHREKLDPISSVIDVMKSYNPKILQILIQTLNATWWSKADGQPRAPNPCSSPCFAL